MAKNTTTVDLETFWILHELILDEAERNYPMNNENIKVFSRDHDKKLVYGFEQEGKSCETSIYKQMLKKIPVLKNHNNAKIPGNFDGKKLYNLWCEYSYKPIDVIEIHSKYLEYYCNFINYSNFSAFSESIKSSNDASFRKRLEELKKIHKEFIEKKLTSNNLEYLEVPSFFCGIYNGYFLRTKESSVVNRFSKFSIVISTLGDKYHRKVYVRTTSSEKFDKMKYYQGECVRINNKTLQLKFFQHTNEGVFEFLFVLAIKDRDTINSFDGFLKGIYAGSDPTNMRPIAGRVILKVIDHAKENYGLESFIDSEQYKPEDLNNDQIMDLFDEVGEPLRNEDPSKKINGRKHFLEFFTNENRFTEDIEFLNKFTKINEEISTLAGIYCIYSLHSSGRYIDKGYIQISEDGQVKINGSIIKSKPNSFRKYYGEIEILANDIFSITAREENNPKANLISYLIKYSPINDSNYDDQDLKLKNYVIYNGVRLMNTQNKKKIKPFAGRVIFVKQDSIDSIENLPLEVFNAFPESESEYHKLKEFIGTKDSLNEYLFNFLIGRENNLLKTFSHDKPLIKEIDYADCFLNNAIMHVRNDSIDQCLLHLYYAQRHGFVDLNKLKEIFSDEYSKIEQFIELVKIDSNTVYFKVSNNTIQLISDKQEEFNNSKWRNLV